MEKYRQGLEPSEFAYPARPKKKIRGYVISGCTSVKILKTTSDGDPLSRAGNESGHVVKVQRKAPREVFIVAFSAYK